MIKKFLNYVEIMTKITSTFAFLMTLAFMYYRNQSINWKLTMVFFASMFLFDLATTAINNYIDTKTNHQILPFHRGTAFIIILVLVGSSTLLGLYLAYLTDIVIFLIGGACFLCGIFYTFGPIPISRQPFGEVISGIFYGLFIPFILLYINMPKGTFLTLGFHDETIFLEIKIISFLWLLLLSIIPMCTTANIMLANNICDLEKDIQVKRFTLPYYFGKNATHLFAGIYYTIYLVIILLVILEILSPICLLLLLTIFPVQANIRKFYEKQDKGITFILSVKNYIIIMATITVLIFISGLM